MRTHGIAADRDGPAGRAGHGRRPARGPRAGIASCRRRWAVRRSPSRARPAPSSPRAVPRSTHFWPSSAAPAPTSRSPAPTPRAISRPRSAPGGSRAPIRQGCCRRFEEAVQKSSATPLTTAEEDVRRRTVILRIGDPGQMARGPLYAYARGDMVLFVQTHATSARGRGAGQAAALSSAPVGDRRALHGSSGACAHSSALTMKPASTSSVAEVT